jgi:hypothetical protein
MLQKRSQKLRTQSSVNRYPALNLHFHFCIFLLLSHTSILHFKFLHLNYKRVYSYLTPFLGRQIYLIYVPHLSFPLFKADLNHTKFITIFQDLCIKTFQFS